MKPSDYTLTEAYSLFASGSASTSIEQPEPTMAVEQKGPSIGFFAIGMVLNIVLIAAFFYWARQQWKKPRKPEE